jgi:hypothetical protein
MTLPSGRSPVPYRLDITESEFALHIDNLLPLRFVATGERLGELGKGDVASTDEGCLFVPSLPATPPRRRGDRVN